MTMTRSLAAAALAALFVLSARAQPPGPPATTITVPEMDCASCAKKLGGKVGEVPGVAKIEYSVEARTLRVTHKAGVTPSPKALWEAIEKGGKEPTRLDGPTGSFSKKPTS